MTELLDADHLYARTLCTLCFYLSHYDHSLFLFFFFNDTATTEIYTLSLHDALPISRDRRPGGLLRRPVRRHRRRPRHHRRLPARPGLRPARRTEIGRAHV